MCPFKHPNLAWFAGCRRPCLRSVHSSLHLLPTRFACSARAPHTALLPHSATHAAASSYGAGSSSLHFISSCPQHVFLPSTDHYFLLSYQLLSGSFSRLTCACCVPQAFFMDFTARLFWLAQLSDPLLRVYSKKSMLDSAFSASQRLFKDALFVVVHSSSTLDLPNGCVHVDEYVFEFMQSRQDSRSILEWDRRHWRHCARYDAGFRRHERRRDSVLGTSSYYQ
eukprot:2168429-Pleurochrysis_carterae.AAC.2